MAEPRPAPAAAPAAEPPPEARLPLAGITVLDLTHHVAGPFCTKLMAGFGARVIKVERPGTGDGLRAVGPFARGPGGERHSIPFLWLNTGKEGITLDLLREDGRRAFLELVRRADVVVESFSPAARAKLGVDFPSLAEVNPTCVLTSITSYGDSGPYRDFEATEAVMYALSGLMALTGDPARPPLRAGPSLTQYTAGMYAYAATLLALYRVAERGVGEHVRLSVQECALQNIEVALAECLHQGKRARRTAGEHALVPWRLYRCRDGYAAVVGGPIRHWLRAADLFGEPRLLQERYRHVSGRMEHRQEVAALLQPWLDRHTRREVHTAGQARGLAFGYVATVPEAMASAQHRARGFFQRISHPEAGAHRYAGPPFRFVAAASWRHAPAPLLGQHDERVSAELLMGSAERVPEPASGVDASIDAASSGRGGDVDRAAARAAPPAPTGENRTARDRRATDPIAAPLEGVRVLDLTHDWAGPHATRILADFGAEVIKVEYPARLDGMRGGIKEGRGYDLHPRWWQINRNKKSVTLDLHRPGDVALLRELVALADVVVENSRPGVLARFGLGYDALRELRPDVVLVSMSAFGQTGPMAAHAGYGGTLEPLSGLQSLTAYDRSCRPDRVKEMDVTNGIAGACAILTALLRRRRTGQGGWVDLSQLEAATACLAGEHLLELEMNGDSSFPVGNRDPVCAPHGCYRCRGEDAWIVIAVRDDAEWVRLRDELDLPALRDSRFATAAARRRLHDEIDAQIERWTRQRSKRAAMYRLQRAGVAAGAVLDVAELCDDPHLAERGFFLSAEDGSGRYPGPPFRLCGPPVTVRTRGPDLGAHNAEVFGGLLGHPGSWAAPAETEIGTAFDPE